jgi:hypothetical protein
MAKKTSSWTAADGSVHTDFNSAQICDLTILLNEGNGKSPPEFIWANRDRVVDILTTKPNSRPTARKINGGKKVRKKRVVAAPEAAPEPTPA